jgi:hypothetical protein
MTRPFALPTDDRLSGPLVAAPGDMSTLVVHCSDGRFGNQCDRFVHSRLGQGMYDRLIVPGGAAWLTDRPELGSESAAARAALALLVEAHQLSRVVLIAHAGCAFYLQKLGVPPERSEARQRADLVAVGRWLRACTPSLHISAYYAHRHGQRVEFKPIFGAHDDIREAKPTRICLPRRTRDPVPVHLPSLRLNFPWDLAMAARDE